MRAAASFRLANPLHLIGTALRRSFQRGYGRTQARADIVSGLVVGIIAVPLSMALAIATGVPPEHGLYTAIIAGAVTALAGGAELQVTGPTAAFVVILVPVVNRFGLGGLCMASAMAGLMLMAMAVFRLGNLVRLVPHPVTLGFTGGIGITIAMLQLKDFFGLPIAKVPEHFFDKVAALATALPAFHAADAIVGASTLAMLLVWPYLNQSIPAALVALSGGTGLSLALKNYAGLHAVNIMDRFSYVVDGVRHAGIPTSLPRPSLHWFSYGLEGQSLSHVAVALIPSAIAIALLAALESLLAAVVADTMSNRRHHSDAELFGVGLGNFAAACFGGFAATGAIARTAANIRSGACSPLAAVVHAVFVLLAMVVLAPYLGFLPMASMSALLLTVAWRMADAKGIMHALARAPKEDCLVLLTSLVLTVVFDMVIAVAVGVLLASLLFSRRMAQTAATDTHAPRQNNDAAELWPAGVVVHEVDGPLFFGDAQRAMADLYALQDDTKAVVLDLSRVSLIDASGIASLEDAVDNLRRNNVPVVMVPPTSDDAGAALHRAHLLGQHASMAGASSQLQALRWASERPGR